MATFHENLVQSFANFKTKYIEPLTPDTKTATLQAGNTTVTFTGIPTSGNHTYDIYTSVPGLEYTDVAESTGSITYTFEPQDNNVTCYLVIKEVV